MKKPKFFQKIKETVTSQDFTIGFRRMSMGLLIFILSFTFLAYFGCLPVFAEGLIQQQDDFHTIEGCWYSLTPSTLGSGASSTQKVDGENNRKYTKYCYSLVDDSSGLDKNTYQYIVNDDDEVYVFEYYTWIDTNTTDTQKIAVWSDTGLESTTINGKDMFKIKNGDNSYVFESIDDYLYYRLYRFLPDWKKNGTYYYTQDDKLKFDDNNYYGYKLLNDDIYKTYKNINVSTEYVFDVKNEDVTYFYKNVYIDSNGNLVAEGGTTDTSERQIINRNDINQATYVIECMGDAYVYTDVNGKTEGQSGFNKNMYYKGNFMYIYSTFEADFPTGKRTISAFKIYKIVNEYKEMNESDFTLDSGYSLITFKNDTKEIIAKAIRYYNLYEISYEIVPGTSSTKFENMTEDAIQSGANVNREYVYDDNGNPTAFNITYTYTINLRNTYDYKITYTRQNFLVTDIQYKKDTTYEYNLNQTIFNEKDITFNEDYHSIDEFTNASNDKLNKYNSQAKFYEIYRTENWSEGGFSCSGKEETPNYGTSSKSSGYVTLGSLSQNDASYTTSNCSYKNNYYFTYETDGNGILSAKQKTISGYYYNNVYYSNKSTYYYGYKTTFTTTKHIFTDLESLPTSNTSSEVGVTYNGGSGTYGLSYTKKDRLYNSPNLSQNNYSSTYGSVKSPSGNVPLSYMLSVSFTSGSMTITVNNHSYDYIGNDDGYYYYWTIGNTVYDRSYSRYEDGNSQYYTNTQSDISVGYVGKVYLNGSWYNLSRGANTFNFLPYNGSSVVCLSLEYEQLIDGGYTDETYEYGSIFYYNVNFLNGGGTPTKYSGSYYSYSSSKTIGRYEATKESENESITLTKFDGKDGYSVSQSAYHQTSSSVTYKYYGTKKILNYESVSFSSNIQLANDNNKLQRSTKHFDDFSIKIPFSLNKDIVLNDNTINEIKNKIKTRPKGAHDNLVIDDSSITINIEKRNIKNEKTGEYEEKDVIIIKYKYYYKDNIIIKKSLCNGSTETESFSVTTGTKEATIECVADTNTGTYVYYNIYELTKTSQENEIEVSSSESEMDSIPNLTSRPGKEDINKVDTSSNYSKKFIKTEYRNQYFITDYKDTNEEIPLYLKSEDVKTNGNYYIAYDANGTLKELRIYKTHNSQNTIVDNTKYYKFTKIEENNDVAKPLYFTKTFYAVDSTKDYSKTPERDEYYKKVVNEFLGRNVADREYINFKDEDVKITNTVNLYSGNYINYYTTIKEVKNYYNYGTSSANFGSSTVKDSGYYNNVSYNSSGKMTNGTWNGGYTLPTSYNLFNDVQFYNNISSNVKKRVSVSNGISYCTLYNPITISVSGNVTSTETKTYYLSYYINDQKYTREFTGSSKTLYNFPNIQVGGDYEYTISRIMFTTEPNKEYTKYVNIGENGYNEKKIAYKTEITNQWYETNETAIAKISNLDEVISRDGTWNSNIKYTFEMKGKTFTYINNEKKYLTGTEYYFDSTTRMRWKTENNRFSYVLNRNIIVTKDKNYGNDYLNTTENADLNGNTYYGNNSGIETTVTNTKNAVKKIESDSYKAGSYVSKDSIIGMLALYREAGYSWENIYLIYNRNTGKYKMVEVSSIINYKYEVYYDNNKDTEDGGINFTYNNKGFEMKDAISYELALDIDGNPIKNEDGTYMYNEIRRDSLVINTDGTLDNLVNSGLNSYNGSKVYNSSSSIPTIKNNHIVNELYIQTNDGTGLTLNQTSDSEQNRANTSDNIDYNDYSYSTDSIQQRSEEYKENDRNYLMFLETTVDNGRTGNGTNPYVNAFYTDSLGNMYRLRNENNNMISTYNTVNQFKRYKEYLIEGKWQQVTSLDYSNPYISSSSYKPEIVATSQVLYKNFIEKEYKISDYGAYLALVGYSGTDYNGLLIGQDIKMGLKETFDANGNSTYKFEFYNGEENSQARVDLNGDDYLSSNDCAETMIANKTNTYFDSTKGYSITADHLLIKRDKVKLYSLTQKIPYELVYVAEEENLYSLPTLDMRYQYQATNFMNILRDSDKPVYIQGDNLTGMFTIKGVQYTNNAGTKLSDLTIYNGAVADNAKQGIIKPGFVTIDGKRYVETIAYNGKIYKIGNIAGEGDLSEDFSRLKDKYVKEIKSALKTISNNKRKDAVEILNALGTIEGNSLFTSTLYNVTIDFSIIKGNYIFNSELDNLVEKMVSIKSNSPTLGRVTRSSNYIRLGKVCYYQVKDKTTGKDVTINDYWSYRGVDTTIDNSEVDSFGRATETIKDNLTHSYGLLGVISGWMNLGLKDSIGPANSENELAYITYSLLIKDTYSKVYLSDILNANANKVNQYFIQVGIGVDGAQASNFLYNLPFTKVEWADVSTGGTSKKQYSTGLHFYNLSSRNGGVRYIASDRPELRVFTTASAWYESLFNSHFNLKANSENMKIAYGCKDYSFQSKIEKDTALFNGASNAGVGYSAIYSSDLDYVYNTYGPEKDPNGYVKTGILPENKLNFWQGLKSNTSALFDAFNRMLGNDANSYINIIQKNEIKDEENNHVRNEYFVMNYCQYETNLPWFTDASNWIGNTRQFFQDVASTIGGAFKWLFKGGDTAEDEWRGEKHYTLQFYQLPTYDSQVHVDNSFKVEKDENTLIKYDVLSQKYIIQDNDYSIGTNFNITITNKMENQITNKMENQITNKMENQTRGKFWGFELYCTTPVSSDFEGWQRDGNTYYYQYKNRLSSKDNGYVKDQYSVKHHINLIMQSDNNTVTVKIQDLPAGRDYVLNLFTEKELSTKLTGYNTYSPAKIVTNLNYDSEYDTAINKEMNTLYFSTGANMVYNPYGENLKNLALSDIHVPSNYEFGDYYLKTHSVIDYEIQKFVYNAENVNVSTYGSGYVDFQHPITKQWYRFSTDVLMKKYLDTENITKIAFSLTGYTGKKDRIAFGDKAEYELYDVSIGKVASTGKFADSSKEAYLQNLILYTLTEQDKLVLNSKYGGVINDKFVNEYLLTNKLIFSVKNTKTKLDGDCRFEISWKPYYEDTMAYLDFNQNGKYDGMTNIVKNDKYYYSSSTTPTTFEAQEAVKVEYNHILSETNWNKTKISNGTLTLDDLLPFYTNGWYQLCLYKDGEAHITK